MANPKKIFTVAILGVGARGGNVYGREISRRDDTFRITALCDKLPEKLKIYGDEFGVTSENRFDDCEKFFEQRRADALIISTYDKEHAAQAIRALELGYDVLLEKPAATNEEELRALLDAQKKHGGRVLICHVLRYSGSFIKLKEILDSGRIGKLIALSAEEPVNYWHQAHSFVRGNARSSASCAPMILAKCCHDLDLICYYAGDKAASVSSLGGLDFFKKENAPVGAADICVDCKYVNECPYSAKRIYVDGWHASGNPENSWPTNALAPAPITEEKLISAIKNGPFGKCVFKCDNDAVDHQLVQMEFENGVKATLSMVGFNSDAGRRYLLQGTYGSIELTDKTLTVREFGKASEVLDVSILNKSGEHGGGDAALIDELYSVLCRASSGRTAIEQSADGYLLGLCAERSRLSNGELVRIY